MLAAFGREGRNRESGVIRHQALPEFSRPVIEQSRKNREYSPSRAIIQSIASSFRAVCSSTIERTSQNAFDRA
jgi:hypothetical protein